MRVGEGYWSGVWVLHFGEIELNAVQTYGLKIVLSYL